MIKDTQQPKQMAREPTIEKENIMESYLLSQIESFKNILKEAVKDADWSKVILVQEDINTTLATYNDTINDNIPDEDDSDMEWDDEEEYEDEVQNNETYTKEELDELDLDEIRDLYKENNYTDVEIMSRDEMVDILVNGDRDDDLDMEYDEDGESEYESEYPREWI